MRSTTMRLPTVKLDCVAPAAPPWPPGVRALTTTRRGPDGRVGPGLGGWNLAAHVGDREATVNANRRVLRDSAGARRVQWLTQVHGSACVEVRSDSAGKRPEADAAWTRESGLALAVLTADCVPVVLCDSSASVVGVAHGGWRGLTGGVLETLVAAMPAAPEDLVAWLGPAIGPDAYEIGEEVAAAVAGLADGDSLASACLRPGRPGHWYLDLFTLSQRLLRRTGVGLVTTGRLCTYSDQRFFSHRRDGRTGRMVTLGWLEGAGERGETAPATGTVTGWRSPSS